MCTTQHKQLCLVSLFTSIFMVQHSNIAGEYSSFLSSSSTKSMAHRRDKAVIDATSWYCAFVLLGLVLVASLKEIRDVEAELPELAVGKVGLPRRPCDEVYVVGEGETLHTISGKCGDPFIVEQNPHIQDPDDVFPGLVIKITSRRPD